MNQYPISRYLNVQMAYFPGFGAGGETITFISDLSGIPQVWQVPAAAGARPWWPRQLTFGDNRVLGVWPAPAGDGNLLAFARDAGGNEKAQIFLLHPDRGELVPLTAGHEEAMHTFGCWGHEGRTLFFAANRRDGVHFDLYRYHRASGETELLWENDRPGYLTNVTLSPDGNSLAFTRQAASFNHDLFLLKIGPGTLRPLSPADRQARYTRVAYGKDGYTLFVVTDLDSDFLHLRRLETAGLNWETVVAPNWDVELLALSPSGRYLAYTVNEAGTSHLELIDLAMGIVRPGPDVGANALIGWADEQLVFSPGSDQEGERLAFSQMSATRTSDVYLWEIEADVLRPVTRSGHGGIPVDTFLAPELVRFPTFDDREIPAWYFRPEEAGDEPLPVVVIVHGGPESQYRPYFNFLIHYLVHSGYAVLAPNVRGSTGYGKAYSHLDDVEKRMDSVADLAHAARWLQAQPEIDGGRIAVYGGSYGGFMVLSALTTYPELWAAGVDIVGISNFVTFLENTSDYRRGHREAEYGSLAEDREFLETIAPINAIDQIQAPLFVIHGANDPRVPLSEAEQLVAALEEREVPVAFLVFDDEGHGIVKRANKKVAFPAVIEFLDRHLK